MAISFSLGCHCATLSEAEGCVAIRNPKAPLCKGSCHANSVTEGLLRSALHRKETDSHGCYAASE